jgi:hypothetical protein
MGGGLGRVSNHPEYYLSDGSVSFLTGNILFRVHKSFFERESEVFRNLFETAAVDDPQSGTDARPFTLDVKPDEFEQLLWVWYDRCVANSDAVERFGSSIDSIGSTLISSQPRNSGLQFFGSLRAGNSSRSENWLFGSL